MFRTFPIKLSLLLWHVNSVKMTLMGIWGWGIDPGICNHVCVGGSGNHVWSAAVYSGDYSASITANWSNFRVVWESVLQDIIVFLLLFWSICICLYPVCIMYFLVIKPGQWTLSLNFCWEESNRISKPTHLHLGVHFWILQHSMDLTVQISIHSEQKVFLWNKQD